MTTALPLSDGDLARPAKELPLKVIRLLGHQLHRNPPMSGNWEILAEELGYGYDDIKQFATMATVRQEMTPGELLLRDWVDQGGCGASGGHTLYVLRDALARIGRQDCVEIMEKEVYSMQYPDTVIHIELTVCIHDDTSPTGTQHLRVRTRMDTSLQNSLQNILQQPLETNYTLLDPGASWTRTLARHYKGRALMLQKTAAVQGIDDKQIGLDQDPTVDSSGLSEDDPMMEERSNLPPHWTPIPAPRVTKPRVNNSTDPQHSGLRQTSRPFPERQRSVTVGPTERNPAAQQMRRSYPIEMATARHGEVVESDVIQNQITHDQHMGRNQLNHDQHMGRNRREWNIPCDICTSDDSPLNDLNINQAIDRQSSQVSDMDDSQISNLHVAKPDQMNIFVSEGKLDNITAVERNDADCVNDIDNCNKCNTFESVRIETIESSDSSFSENYLTDESNKDDMMMGDADYQRSFDDITDNTEYRDDFETSRERDQTPEMSFLKGLDDKSPDFGISLTELKPPYRCNSLVHDEASIKFGHSMTEPKLPYQGGSLEEYQTNVTTSSSESDKEFVEHKFMPLATSKSDTDSKMHGRNTDGYPYIDFNKYPQTISTPSENASLGKEMDEFVGANLDIKGDMNANGQARYESLQRQISCPADLHPYRSYRNTANDFSTIADVFSPLTENPPEQNFEQRQESDFVGKDQTKLLPENNANRWQSFSGRTPGKAINANKFHRHTFAQGQRKSALAVHFTDQETCVGAPSTNQWGRLSCLETMDNDSIPPPTPHNLIKVKPHPYKVFVQGRSDRRTSLDAAVVGDNLFSFYNNQLRGEPGWSPLETECTVEGTMRDILHQDGFYMLWYSRTKRNLMITVSDRGQFVHVRVRSKVHNDHLNFYVVPGVLHREVHQLLQCCLEQGLSVQHSGNTLQGTRGRENGRIWMRCPVVVQYERKPAVSV